MMEYVYAGMWFLIGLLLIWKLRKENQVFVFAGGIFLFMGAWWLADACCPSLTCSAAFTRGFSAALWRRR